MKPVRTSLLKESAQVFSSRKRDHLQLALRDDSQTRGSSGLGRVELVHEALPNLDFEEVQVGSPFFIAGMTAGHVGAISINERLAEAAEKRDWIFGVGSQRREIFKQKKSSELSWRHRLPRLRVVGNLGLSQLVLKHRQTGESGLLDWVESRVKQWDLQMLAVHLNAHQEVIQPEGTPFFKGGWDVLQILTEKLSVPVIVKETGCGISLKTARRLAKLSLHAIDVSGLGGTHWGRIEGMRASGPRAQAARVFKNWGISTLDSVLNANEALAGVQAKVRKRSEIWASGGVRSGLDAAKLLAVGADRVGFAQPALRAALKGSKFLLQWMDQIEFELKVALWSTGCKTVAELRKKEVWNLREH